MRCPVCAHIRLVLTHVLTVWPGDDMHVLTVWPANVVCTCSLCGPALICICRDGLIDVVGGLFAAAFGLAVFMFGLETGVMPLGV